MVGILLGSMKGREHSEDVGVDGRILEYTRVVFKSFRTGRLEQELQRVQLSATRCSRIAIL
jgi:hypothetical protein